MENRRRSPELPDVIIQHIQSFLKPKEAAQMMLISKSWLRAWSTRPFLFYNTAKDLWLNKSRYIYVSSYVIDRTLESYVDEGTPIVKLDLFVDIVEERWLKMARQSNVIDLHLRAGCKWTDSMFQEIFLTKSLQVLNITSSHRFIPQLVLRRLDIKCRNLRKLEFRNLQIDEVTFQHIMSSCPLIDELLLTKCSLIHSPANNLGSQSCKRLKRLSLVETQINHELLHTILSKSTQLEDFNLIRCTTLVKSINLSSVSLKRVNLDMKNVQVVIVDAPNLHKLNFSSCSFWTIPFPITITKPITKGVVKVTIIKRDGVIDNSWFHVLKEFLAKFAKSNVKLTSKYSHPLGTDFKLLRMTPLPSRHEVESLRFKELINLPLLYAFFSICHPKIVFLDRPESSSMRKHFIELLKDISYRGNLECCNLNDQNKCWRHYVKLAKLYYWIDNKKKPLDMNRLETRLGNNVMIVLALEWKSSY